MSQELIIDQRRIAADEPVYFIAEIGINHNGDMDIARKLIDLAAIAGCNAVKFQKRTPELCVPAEQRDIIRETPWGNMTYMEYRQRVEFGREQYAEINNYCRQKGITWFASCWDVPSVEFMEQFDPACYKIASATLTNEKLMRCINDTGRPVILSTGMSTMEEIDTAVSWLDINKLAILHATSTYPCKPEEINLRMMDTLRERFDCPIGYSGHEVGLQISLAAAALGACILERHITLDRAMWGSDQAASVELGGVIRLVRDMNAIKQAMGDGVKKVYDGEIPMRKKLRKI